MVEEDKNLSACPKYQTCNLLLLVGNIQVLVSNNTIVTEKMRLW